MIKDDDVDKDDGEEAAGDGDNVVNGCVNGVDEDNDGEEGDEDAKG